MCEHVLMQLITTTHCQVLMTLMTLHCHGFGGPDHVQHYLKMQFSGGVMPIYVWQREAI